VEDGDQRRKRLYRLHTDALVLHCPGPLRRPARRTARDWESAQRTFFADQAGATENCDDPNLTVITYNTRSDLSLLERCSQHLGLRQLVVLGRDLPDWRFEYKIELVRSFLEHVRVREYVMCLDAVDVLMLAPPGLVLDRFRQMNTHVLFSSTAWDWPPSRDCWQFENAVAADAPRAHRHLNSGAYIGTTASVKRYIDEIADAIRTQAPWCRARRGFDDQLAWREMHRRHHPSIAVDTGCTIFARFDEHR